MHWIITYLSWESVFWYHLAILWCCYWQGANPTQGAHCHQQGAYCKSVLPNCILLMIMCTLQGVPLITSSSAALFPTHPSNAPINSDNSNRGTKIVTDEMDLVSYKAHIVTVKKVHLGIDKWQFLPWTVIKLHTMWNRPCIKSSFAKMHIVSGCILGVTKHPTHLWSTLCTWWSIRYNWVAQAYNVQLNGDNVHLVWGLHLVAIMSKDQNLPGKVIGSLDLNAQLPLWLYVHFCTTTSLHRRKMSLLLWLTLINLVWFAVFDTFGLYIEGELPGCCRYW
jgi:hypothetical protein